MIPHDNGIPQFDWTPCAGLLVAREHEKTKRDVEKISGAGDESIGMELGPSDKVGSRQETWAFFGCGLRCDPTRRGLSKYVNFSRTLLALHATFRA